MRPLVVIATGWVVVCCSVDCRPKSEGLDAGPSRPGPASLCGNISDTAIVPPSCVSLSAAVAGSDQFDSLVVSCAEDTILLNGFTSDVIGVRSTTVGDILDEMSNHSPCELLVERYGILEKTSSGICRNDKGTYEVFFAETAKPTAAYVIEWSNGSMWLKHSEMPLLALDRPGCRRLER